MADEWGVCPACRKPRIKGAAFAWCGGAAQWLHEECAVEHRQQVPGASDGQLGRSGGHTNCCAYWEDDQPMPSQNQGPGGWFQVDGKTWPQRTPWTGKWLLYWQPQDVDEAWGWVRWGTLVGEWELGYAAKVADHTNLSPRDGPHTCCVYTVDCRDRDDVRGVLTSLRRLGFDQKLFYKEDAATDRLIYGSSAVLYVSPAGTTDLARLREPIAPEPAESPESPIAR